MEYWSWNEAFGEGFDYDGHFGDGFSDALMETFGKKDILLEVPDKTDFLNPLKKNGTTKELEMYKQEQKALEAFIQQFADQNKISGKPRKLMSDEDILVQQAYLNQRAQVEKEKRMIEDPIRELTNAWQAKFENDERGLSTFFTGAGTESERGIIGTSYDVLTGEAGERAYAKLVGDTIGGVSTTAVKLMPEINKANVSLAGEFLGNVPLYFLDRKYIHRAITDPKKYPMDAGKLTLTAGAGAYTAATAYDYLSTQIRAKKDLPDPRTSTDQRLVNMQHGIDAMVFTGGAAGLDAAFRSMKNTARFAYGVKEGKDSGYLAQLVLDRKAPFGITNVSDRSWAQWYGRVLGVFPFVGTPIRQAKAKQAWWADEQLSATLNELAPLASAMDAGVFLTKDAQDKFGKWARLNNNFYDDFYAKARALDDAMPISDARFGTKGGYIPTFRMRALAEQVLDQTQRGVTKLEGPYIAGVPDQIGGLEGTSNFEKFLINLGRQPEYVNAEQYRATERAFNTKWGEYVATTGVRDSEEIAAQAHKFKVAMKHDFNNIQEWKKLDDPVLNAQMAQVKKSLSLANENFIKMANTYESPVGQVFKLVDQNMFTAGSVPKAGVIYADQLANQVFDTFFTRPSALAMKDLSKIIKRNSKNPQKDAINISTRTFLTKAWNQSSDQIKYNNKTGAVENYKIQQKAFDAKTGTQTLSSDVKNVNVFNPDKFRKSLNMGTKDGDEFLQAMFAETLGKDGKKLGQSGAKAHLQQLNELLDLAGIGYKTKIPETAQFVARRAVLGGVTGLSGAFIASNMAFGPVGGLGMALLARHQAKVLSDPQNLKWLMSGMFEDGLNSQMKKANITRLARAVLKDEPDVPENLDYDDIEDITNYLMGRKYQVTKTTGNPANAPGGRPEQPKTFAPIFPQKNPVERGPEQIKLDEMRNPSNNVSGEIKTKPVASNMSSPIRPMGGAQRGQLNPQQRAALAGGNIYGAIATAKRGGIIYRDGIMNLAGRRKP